MTMFASAPAHLRHLRACVLVALVSVVLAGCTQRTTAPTHERVTIRGEDFLLELAITDAARARGLMHRTELAADGGMLFIFPRPEVRSFWMANCLIDIDLIFLDGRGRITALHRMKAEPPRREDEDMADYESRMKPHWSGNAAQFAIELQAGSLDRLDLKLEERIELDLPRLKALAR